MSETKRVVSADDNLASLIADIKAGQSAIFKAQDKVKSLRVGVGMMLIDLRKRANIQHGEWQRFYCEHFPPKSFRDAQKCMKLAGASDPEAAAEAERKASRDYQAERRAEGKSGKALPLLALDKIEKATANGHAADWAEATAALVVAQPQPEPVSEPVIEASVPASSCGLVPLRPANPSPLEAAVFAAADAHFLATRDTVDQPNNEAEFKKNFRACGKHLERVVGLIHDSASPSLDDVKAQILKLSAQDQNDLLFWLQTLIRDRQLSNASDVH